MLRIALRRLLPFLCALGILVPPSAATWSIVVVNRRTGEVCISSATCLTRIDLTLVTPVLLVGHGGAVAQASIDDGQNKVRIWDGFLAGRTPEEILASIRVGDPNFRARQFGIVDIVNPPLTYTGGAAGRARKGVAGVVGDLVYAIQGNVLASDAVIDECEAVLRTSTGDLGQRVLAAMVRARELGGDGRCSCGGVSGNCGTPPADFRKSAHIAFLTVARVGDVDGSCVVGAGCASGDYYLDLSIFGRNGLINAPDPVDQLVERYGEWRAQQLGHPDGLLSRVRTVDSLPADGRTERVVTIELVDVDGLPLDHGGATVEVAAVDGKPTLGRLGPVRDHGDGSYSFTIRASEKTGLERLVVRAADGHGQVTLWPPLEVRHEAPKTLHAGRATVSASAPEDVPFVLDAPAYAGGKYQLVAKVSGMRLRGPSLPLNVRGLLPGRAPFFPAPPAPIDARGRAEALYAVRPGALAPLIGLRLEWSARLFGSEPTSDSNTVGFTIVP